MRIRITKPGIYGADGEIPVGTELELQAEPKGWDGRFEIVGKTEGKTEVNNDGPKTAKEALALFSTEGVHVNSAKAQAKKFLGDKIADDASKDDIIAKLTELAAAEQGAA